MNVFCKIQEQCYSGIDDYVNRIDRSILIRSLKGLYSSISRPRIMKGIHQKSCGNSEI